MADAKVTSTRGTNTDGNTWKFSYLSYDNMDVSISAGNTGNTVTVSGDVNSTSFNLSHGDTKSFTITQTRQYCRQKTNTRTMSVVIKPVTAFVPTNEQMWLWYDGDDAGDEAEIKGSVSLGYNGGNWTNVRSFDKNNFKERTWDSFNHSYWSCVLYSPSDSVSILSENMKEDDPTNDDDIGEVNTSVALSWLKNNRTWEVSNGISGDCGVKWKTQYTLSD